MKPSNSSLEQHFASMSRRNFLRGLGACIALPAFTSMVPSRLFAADPALQLATTSTGARAGQETFAALRYAPFPVVGAPAGMALGGGCEVLLHCDAIQAH